MYRVKGIIMSFLLHTWLHSPTPSERLVQVLQIFNGEHVLSICLQNSSVESDEQARYG